MNHILRTAALALILVSGSALAGGDAIKSTLSAQQGKRVTVQLRSGQELTGTVQAVDADTVKLAELSGKEFFDATVRLEAVDAVIARARDK